MSCEFVRGGAAVHPMQCRVVEAVGDVHQFVVIGVDEISNRPRVFQIGRARHSDSERLQPRKLLASKRRHSARAQSSGQPRPPSPSR